MANSPYPSPCKPAPRALFAAAAVAVSLGSFAVLLGAFESSSPQRWLLPTPMLMADLERCNREPDRSARERCAVRVVAVHAGDQAASAQHLAQR
jgi:hypothetical protein